MVLSEGTLARARHVRRAPAMPAVGVVLVTIVLAAALVDGQVARLAAAIVAAWIVLRAIAKAEPGRTRRVRSWIGFAVVVWVAAEAIRLASGVAANHPLVAGLVVAGLVIGATGTYVAAARARMRPADEWALYLDAASIVGAITGAVLVIGSGLTSDPAALSFLVHAAFFVAILCATVLLDLSTRVPLRIVGPWEVPVGLALGAAGYLGLLNAWASGPVAWTFHAAVAIGVLLVGHGGANWTPIEDRNPRYAAVASWLRGLLPLASALLTGVLVIMLITQPMLVEGWLRWAAGTALGLVVVCAIARQTVLLADRERVIHRERQLSDELTVAEAQYRSVVERVPGVVYVAEAGQHGRWHFVSTKIRELLGYTAEEWTSDPTLWINRMHPADRERMIHAETSLTERIDDKGRWEYRLLAKDGHVVWVIDDEAIIARDADGRATMVQGILVDISDRKDLEEQLRHQALHDPLTGLPNRVLFVDRLSHALVRRAADGGLAVLFVDLDDFKAINDTLGHAAGDEMLRLVAERLTGVLRAGDTACRLGGDEFAFLLEDAPRLQAVALGERILAALAEPFEIAGHAATLTASIGIAIKGASVDRASSGETADELLRDADTAMYAAKSLGKSGIQVFERGMDEPVSRRRELRTGLEKAIEANELFLEYQPIIDMCDGSLTGVEALVRWNHPQLGRLMPADFIALAEETDHIKAIGDWVLRHAAADLADSSIVVSVNVSAHQLGDATLPALVADVLRETGLAPGRLLLELTESTLASAGAGAETELAAIHALGVRIALDDFGSGYSSLEYLGRLPIDVLKIDRSLVERIDHEPQRREVILAVEHIATKLGLQTIVEGIEREEQQATLLELGFCQAQGYLFAPPLPLEAALDPARPRFADPASVPVTRAS
jgi:diguanylate cyclase (GGDEF)-like protein/PAS domain S-box-containing protein